LNFAAADAPCANAAGHGATAFLDANFLQVGFEESAGNTRGFATVSAKVFRLPALRNAVTERNTLIADMTLLTHNFTSTVFGTGRNLSRFS